MKRWLLFGWSVFNYLVFLGVFLYAIAFIGNLFVSRSLDSPPRVSPALAIAIDAGLLAVFAVQHSVMARPAFKRWITGFLPQPAERPTYVLATNLALIALFAFWQPVGPVIWQLTVPFLSWLVYAVWFGGWALVFVATCLINHFDLFGLRHGWYALQGKPYPELRFATPWLYKQVRHPLYVGWFIVFWAAPTMTAGHLFFAVMTTVYILIAVRLEERDLVAAHGSDYVSYQNEVPMFLPRLSRRQTSDSGVHTWPA